MIEVTAAVIRNEGRILICRRREGEKFGGLWEFPGGKTEPGESPEEGLRREILEELELDVRIGKRLGSVAFGQSPDEFILTAFFADPASSAAFVLREHAEALWVGSSELGRFVFAPPDRAFVDILRNRGNE